MAASDTEDLDVGPGRDKASDRIVPMQVFKGRGTTDVRLGSRAPFGWWPAVVLSLVSLLDRLEQSMLAGALTTIENDLGLSNTESSLIFFFTGIAGVLLFIPAGRIADRMNRKNGLALVVASWSVLSLGSGLAVGFAMLLAMRTLLGAAGQLNNPAGSSLLGDYYPGESRTRVFGIERFIYFMGNPLGVVLGAIIAETYGWRWVFACLVIPGLLISLMCWLLREPYRGTADRIDAMRADVVAAGDVVAEPTMHEVATEDESRRDVSVWEDVRFLLRIPTLRAVYIAQGAMFLGLGLFAISPKYYEKTFDLSTSGAGAVTGGTGMIAMSLGAFLGIRLGERNHGRVGGWRISVGAGGLVLGTLGVAIYAAAPVVPIAMAGFALMCVGFMIAIPNFTAAIADSSSSARRGMAFSTMQVIIGVSSALSPVIVSAVADAFGPDNFRLGFAALLVPLALSALLALRARGTYESDAEAARLESSAAGAA